MNIPLVFIIFSLLSPSIARVRVSFFYSPFIYLFGFVIYLFIQNIFGIGDKRLTFIFLSQFILAAFIDGYYNKTKAYQSLDRSLIIVSIISGVVLIAQTRLKIDFWPVKFFQGIGLISTADRNYIEDLDQVFYNKGIGLSSTVTDFASHLWVLFFFSKRGLLRIFSVVIVLINQSLSSIIGVFVSVFYSKRLYVAFIIAIFIIFFLGSIELFNLIQSENSILSRFVMWDKAISLWAGNPITGVGLGTNIELLRSVPGFFFDFPFPDIRIAIHSVLFDLLSGTGLIGACLYGLFLYKVLKLKTDQRLKLALLYSVAFALFNNTHYMAFDIPVIASLMLSRL